MISIFVVLRRVSRSALNSSKFPISNPFSPKQSAHMALIDAMMSLFSKDVLIPEKIVEVVSRFAPIDADEVPLDIEEVALFWLNKSSERFRQVIEDELNSNEADSINYIPCLPYIQDITELNTGCSLVALLSFYCPEYLNWREVSLKEQNEMCEEECVKNLETVQYFCAKYLPYDICFIELENFLKIKGQMRINLLTFIADLLYLFEVKPATCVRRPEYELPADDYDYDFKENERINHNNNLTMANKKKMRDLVAADLRTRSQQHTSWTTNDEDEDTINEEIRNQQKRLRNFIHAQQQQQQAMNYCDSNASDQFGYANAADMRKTARLNADLQSLSLNHKDSSSENEFYLNPHHNAVVNSDGSESSSTLSFAKLSKIKNSSISHNLNEPDGASINVVYSSDQDDYVQNAGGKSAAKRRNSVHLKAQQEQATGNSQQLSNGSQQEEAEIANQILQIHMKLEEKKKQIALEKQQVESMYKTQKRDISNEAFLKALKIEKMMNQSKEDDLSAYEIKESLSTLRKNLPPLNHSEPLKSDQYYNDIKSSIDILSSSVIDLEKDLSQLEEEKVLVKQQKQNLDQLIGSQLAEQYRSNSQLPNSSSYHELPNDSSRFYLHHADKSAGDEQLASLLSSSKLNKLSQQQQDDYLDAKSLSQKLMIDSLNSMHGELMTNSNGLRRGSVQESKQIENLILNDNNGT